MNCTRASFFVFVLYFSSPAMFLSTAKAAPPKTVIYKVGVMHRQFAPPEPYDGREAKTHALVTDIWYPADPAAVEQMQWIGSPDAPFAKGAKAARDAALIAGS